MNGFPGRPNEASSAASKDASHRLLVWVAYGQYGFMPALALAGALFLSFRDAHTGAAGVPGRATAVAFAVLFAMIGGYSLWRLYRHFVRQRSSGA